jgi:hypothetical protein
MPRERFSPKCRAPANVVNWVINRAAAVVRRGTQGWSDAQVLMSLILLNLAGGDCVDDLSILQSDPGFAEVLHRVETHGMPRRDRRALLQRFRKERTAATPSPSSVFRYLSAFHDPHGAADREPHKAFIPAAGEHLRGLARVNADVVAFVQSIHHISTRRWIKMPRWWRRIKPMRSFRINIFARISRSIRTGPNMTSRCIRSSAMATFRRDSSNGACSKTRSRCYPTMLKPSRCAQTPPAIRPNCSSIVPKGRTSVSAALSVHLSRCERGVSPSRSGGGRDLETLVCDGRLGSPAKPPAEAACRRPRRAGAQAENGRHEVKEI